MFAEWIGEARGRRGGERPVSESHLLLLACLLAAPAAACIRVQASVCEECVCCVCELWSE